MMAQRRKVRDRAAMLSDFYTVEQIGPKRALTPEGFLLCSDVPFARVGEMVYGPGETPIKTKDGLARVSRDANALFSPECMNSFNGKPVVDDHPPEDVTPENWQKLSAGVSLNVRRGTGDDADCLVADLLITKKQTIRDVLAGKREVSAGYDADYEQTGEGLGRQTGIIGNHIALVDRGRCGPRCAIGDHQPKEVQSMTTKTQPTSRRVKVAEKIRQIFRDAEASLADDPDLLGGSDDMDSDGAGATHIHIHAGGAGASSGGAAATPASEDPAAQELDGLAAAGQRSTDEQTEARFQALEQGHKEILAQLSQIMQMIGGGGGEGGGDPPPAAKTGDETPPEELEDLGREKTGDSAALEKSYQKLISDVEILAPGYRLPTFDAKMTRAATIDRICTQRRAVLRHLAATTDGKALLDSATGTNFALSAEMSCATVAQAFMGAVAIKRALNNSAVTRDAGILPRNSGPGNRPPAPRTPAELNSFYAAHYAAKK